ncbi:hypothetical protein GTG28_07010 [Vibrio sp. OCN044]|uniref:Leucine-rich repeat domain-containing protein n=1 Tax=Vibrio tetraodonis subsp. pristinus TaxID=2695891 RepID=A0A6L8LWD6_9VIBR|nr:leucine-rich repeat domain-containing protein [Vibrio tetraodonis]MYM58970.1 hypothetical protein [Vibrio tetraodonis subsp. pristinus]
MIERINTILAALSISLVLASQAFALTTQQQADAIINASPVVQKIQQNFKPEYGNLSFFVEGLTGRFGELPSSKREWGNNDILPFIIGGEQGFKGGGSLSRIMIMLDQQGKAKSVISERTVTLPTELIDAIQDAQYLRLSSSVFLDSTVDLSSFNNLERVDIAFSKNVEHIILPKSGKVEKIIIFQESLKRISNLGKQKNLNLLKSTAENSTGFEEINGSKTLKDLSIYLSDPNINIGSIIHLQRLWLANPRYENIRNINSLDKLKKLTLRNLSSEKISRISLPKNLEKISIFDVSKNSLPDIKDLVNLQELVLWFIEDNVFKSTSNLPEIKELFISKSNLPTLNGIEKLPSLKDLTVKESGTIDISAIEALHHLENLQITDNYLDDISVIAKLPKLVFVNASYNQLKVLPKLQPGNHLESFVFSDNPIETIDPEVLKTYSKVSKRAYRTPFYQSLTRKQQLYF